MDKLFLLCVYIIVLIPLAWWGHRRSEEKTLKDFYLAGGKLGFLVLLCTLFSTQYSGNTFMAFPGKAYRMGYAYMMSVGFMMAIVGCYLLFAPALRKIAVRKNFITPCDWILFRYRSHVLTILCAVLMIWALVNFLLAQLIAMGHAVSGLTDGKIPFETGVLFLAVVIVLYETIGGMRAVAWTDTLQGGIMFVAILILGSYLLTSYEDLQTLPARIMEIHPEKVFPPNWITCMTWGSSIFIVGLGGAMYPQAIQRIYAANSTRTLKRSLSVMVFLPLLIVLFAYIIGLMAIPAFQDLGEVESDQVMALMLNKISEQGVFLNIGVSLLLLGALAAMMSTADSVLLSLSSILVKDLVANLSSKPVKEQSLLKLGKILSWIIAGILVIVALNPKITLFRLLEIKFEVLVQVAPAFILGLYLPSLRAGTAILGILAGCAIAFTGFFQGGKWMGLHPGTIGCVVNFIVCLAGSWLSQKRRAGPSYDESAPKNTNQIQPRSPGSADR